MKLQTIAKVVLAATAMVSLVAAQAAGSGMPGGVKGGKSPGAKPDAVGPLKLVKTWTGVGNGNSTPLPQFAFTTVDSATVSCANTAGCHIGIETMAQIQSAGADWAICLAVDGIYISCQYQGNLSGPSSYVVGNARGLSGSVTSGSHAVRTDLYTESASATYQYFQSDYRVYKP